MSPAQNVAKHMRHTTVEANITLPYHNNSLLSRSARWRWTVGISRTWNCRQQHAEVEEAVGFDPTSGGRRVADHP
jgi:hypothetical protein